MLAALSPRVARELRVERHRLRLGREGDQTPLKVHQAAKRRHWLS